jgi:hypothetical protein
MKYKVNIQNIVLITSLLVNLILYAYILVQSHIIDYCYWKIDYQDYHLNIQVDLSQKLLHEKYGSHHPR